MKAWLTDFLTDTEAELVLAGYAETRTGGQTALHLFVYLPPQLVAEAEELAGWYAFPTYLSDRQLTSTRALASARIEIRRPSASAP